MHQVTLAALSLAYLSPLAQFACNRLGGGDLACQTGIEVARKPEFGPKCATRLAYISTIGA